MNGYSERHDASRRKFLITSAAVGGAVATTSIAGIRALKHAADASSPTIASVAEFVRPNLSSPDFPADGLDSYRLAVEAMLRLPPDHPHNWYRLALTHLTDCRHASGWFLPWHRGYLGWFERICRRYSNNPRFTLPYWDWTASPSMPLGFFEGVLDVRHALYCDSEQAFERLMRAPIDRYWAALTPAQLKHLAGKSIRTGSQLWKAILGSFVPSTVGRHPSSEAPDMSDYQRRGVAPAAIGDALAPRAFAQFSGSAKTEESAMLEAGPHATVHFFVLGTMAFDLSPVDPIFYLHHANVDRLWCEWVALQEHEQLPTLLQGDEYQAWASETFEFFVDEHAAPIAGSTVGRYATPETFGYRYEPSLLPVTRPPSSPQTRGQEMPGAIERPGLSFDEDAIIRLSMTPLFHEVLIAGGYVGLRLRMSMPVQAAAWRFELWLGSGDAPQENEQLAHAFTIFGSHGGDHHAARHGLRFGLSQTLLALTRAGQLEPGALLRLRVKAVRTGYAEPKPDVLEIGAAVLELL
jgi:hypothetical protein